MAITREKKEQLVADYQDQLTRSKAFFFTDYRGLSVAQFETLRAKIREAGGSYAVVKNNLAALALKNAELPVPEDFLTGPVAISFAFDEIPALAKTLADFAKSSDILEIKGGLMDGEIIDRKQVETLANLPPREIVLAQLLGLIQQPGNRVAGVVNAAGAKLAATIKAYSDKLEISEVSA